jgi:hypothetical protein
MSPSPDNAGLWSRTGEPADPFSPDDARVTLCAADRARR